MNLINETELLEAGWLPGPDIQKMLEATKEMAARGIQDPNYAMKLLRRQFPLPDRKLRMRDEPTPLAQAIVATSDMDAKNIGAVQRCMVPLLRVPVVQRGAIMPDACPAGNAVANIPVGGVIAVHNAIIPSAHSEDICCSMYASFYQSNENVADELDALTACTRFGQGGRKEEDWVSHPVLDEPVWSNPFLHGLQRHAAMHLADQGDGNHFAYLGTVDFSTAQLEALQHNGHGELARNLASHQGRWKVLITHHGSRGFGAHLYKRGQKAAEKHTAKIATGIPEAACWLDFSSDEGSDYWEALQYISRWTKANHQCIHEAFAAKLQTTIAASIGNEHNFVWKRGDTFYHGKGATPAWPDEMNRPQLGLIPLNMAAPILLVMGKNNQQFLSFAPHGAGRNISRRAATRPYLDKQGHLSSKDLERLVSTQTPGLDIRWWHGKADLGETPLAYKSAAQVMEQIEHFDLAEILVQIQPLGCIMAGDAGPRAWDRELELTPKQKRQIEHRADRRKSHQTLTHWDDEEMTN